MVGAARLALILLMLVGCAAPPARDAARTRRGDLPLLLVESGEIAATRSTTLNAPLEWGGDLQIVFLAEEGMTAAAGDTLVRFDAGFLEKEMAEARAQLAVKEAEERGVRASQASRREELLNARTTADLSVEQASLQLEKMRFESATQRAEARLRRRQAELALQEAEAKLQAQAVLDSLELAKVQVERAELQSRLDGMERRVAALVLTAPAPGLVLHAEQRGSEQGARVRVGDKVRPRSPVVEIPDLSTMEVVFPVHEMDRGRVEPGQAVRVRLEAAPQRRFDGVVTSIARLAVPRRADGVVKGFEVRARLEGLDPLLRPGMSAEVEVLLQRLENVILVPRGALFEEDGRAVVHPVGATSRPVTVLGAGPLEVAVSGVEADLALSTRPPAASRPLGEARWSEESLP
jgi:HlyD family secretion protein